MSNPTRIMRLRDTLKTEFEGMTTANGYNNDFTKVIRALVDPSGIKVPLHLGFVIGRRITEKLNDKITIFTKAAEVTVQVVKQLPKKGSEENIDADDAQELVINDVERKVSSFMTSYINDTVNPWNVSFDNETFTSYPMITTDRDEQKLVIIFTFNVKLRRLKGITD